MGNPFWNELYFGYYVDYNFKFVEAEDDLGGDENEIHDEDELKFYLRQFCKRNGLDYTIVGENRDGYIVIGKYIGENGVGNLRCATLLEFYPKASDEDKKHVKSMKAQIRKLLNVPLEKPSHILVHHVREYN